jgi:predicted nucleic-acid-binding protein
MIAVDTNVLVRILVDDPGQPMQNQAARELASHSKQVFVLLIVQVETTWVLETGYGLAKERILSILGHLQTNSAFVLEDPTLCHTALELYQVANLDYSDCLILGLCRSRDRSLHTFDKRLGKLDGATLVTAAQSGNGA